jgi:hypothetical protein
MTMLWMAKRDMFMKSVIKFGIAGKEDLLGDQSG